MSALGAIGADDQGGRARARAVPVIDATGLVALESALDRLQRNRKF